jgi:hypothetical protein
MTKVWENETVVDALRELTQTSKSENAVSVNLSLINAAYKEIESRYYSLYELAATQEQIMIGSIDSEFVSLVSGKITAKDYDERINNMLEKKLSEIEGLLKTLENRIPDFYESMDRPENETK